MAITNYGREVAGTLTRRADSSAGWMQGGVVVSVLAYDGWNQAAAEETCQTLRAVASEGRGE